MDAGFTTIKYDFILIILYVFLLYLHKLYISYVIHLKALLRYWRRLGLMDAPKKILSMTMTMALIPSDCFEEALSFIQVEVDQISNDYPAVNDFLTYVRKTWLPLAAKVSVYDCPVRTNNITESFHSMAQKKFSKAHENVWSFLGNVF